MALSEARLGEIAVLVLAHKMRKNGMEVQPREIRSEIFNGARSLGISPIEMAEFQKLGLKVLFDEANKEIDQLVSAVESWQPPKQA